MVHQLLSLHFRGETLQTVVNVEITFHGQTDTLFQLSVLQDMGLKYKDGATWAACSAKGEHLPFADSRFLIYFHVSP